MAQALTKQAIALIEREIGNQSMLDMVADGKSQRAIAKHISEKIGRPVSHYYVNRYLHRDEEADAAYKAATLIAANNAAGKIQEITDELLDGRRDPGSVKVASDNLKWIAAKLDPSTYSDKAQIDIQVTDIAALHINAMREAMRTVSTVKKDDRDSV